MKISVLGALSLLFVMSLASPCFAQNWPAVRAEVMNELTSLKPVNTTRYVYRVKGPNRPRVLPAELRVDLIYKDGHYDFEYTAVRFERHEGKALVDISYFSYGSTLGFWREYSQRKQDLYLAKLGTMPVSEFDSLLMRAVAYYDSDIDETYVPPKALKKNGGTAGVLSKGATMTSGDGSIALAVTSGSSSILKDEGSLYGGDLKSRMDNGYKDMRPNLFWKVFHDRLVPSVLITQITGNEIEQLAIARLTEPPPSNTYCDYYRQSVFIELLGEYGSSKSLDTLRRVSFDSGLDPMWHEQLQRDISHAVKKISSRQ